MESNNTTIVDDHRNMLMISKNISTFQEQNLKQWPLIVLDNVDSVKVDYDFINNQDEFFEGKVSFDFTFKEGQYPTDDKRKKAFEDLTIWTKFLFWSNTSVEFKLRGREWK